MAEAEYAAGPRLISDSDSFAAWSDVPENLRKTILRLLPNGSIFLRRVETSTCQSGWLAGCALCTSALWAVKVKGRHGDNYHAAGLESHFARDTRHHPDVSASDPAHRRHIRVVTHALTPFMQPLLTCVRGIHVCLHVCEACVLLRAWTLTFIDTCRDTRMQWIALTRTHARACIGHPSVRRSLCDSCFISSTPLML